MKLKVNKLIFSLIFICTGIFSQQEDSLVIDYNYINSIPQNANLYLNDEFIGKTPMHFRWDTTQQKNVIKIKLSGYADMVYSPSGDEKFINKTFKLVSLTGSNNKQIVLKDKTFAFNKPLKIVPIIVSSVITAGSAIMAYYFKSKAIEKSDEFEITGDPALLDKKKKYDVIGGISLAVFQIGLSALIYFHFIDN